MRKLTWLAVLLLTVTVINYPNPFNPANSEITTIKVTSDTTGEAFIYIYDLAARLLARKNVSLVGGSSVTTTWDGYSDYNELVGSGVYLYQVISANQQRLGRGKIWIVNSF